MEISSIELKYITFKLNSILARYYVNNVYLINPLTVLIRLHHSEKPEARLILSASKGLWLTRYELPKRSGGISSKLRREVSRAKIRKITQPKGERIAILEFEEAPDVRRVILEFFGGGNIIITDGDNIIRSLLRPLRVRHRTVKVGERYLLPPARGVDVTTLKREDLAQIQKTDLVVSRWLGRNLALSKKYVEEVLARAGIDIMVEGRRLSEADVSRLYEHLKSVVDMVLAGDIEPTVIYRDGVPIDASPFRLKSHQGFEIRRFKTFMEALDEVLTKELLAEIHVTTFEPLRRKIEEIRSAIEHQKEAEVKTRETASTLREYAKRLQEKAYQTPGLQEVPTELLLELGASDATIMKGRLILKIQGATIESASDQSLMKTASQIFGEAKKLEKKVDAIKRAETRLKAELEQLEGRMEERVIEAKMEKPEVKREKAWYERYRWFKTSEGLLAVGGRDASTNSIIMRRYTEEKDLVFHADLHGSPFFILKGYSPSEEKSIEEVAQAVVSFSRAWKEGLSSADAYWIHPHQVKRQAPSGMYLPRGSFLIQGSRNYVKNVRVECAVGLTVLDGYLMVVSGPPEAIRHHSVAYVVLAPDRGKVSDTARRIRSELMDLLGEETSVKRIPLDDYVRALPAGGGRIVLKGLGEQKYKSG